MIELAQLPIFRCNLDKEPLSAHGFKSARRGAQWKHWPLVGFRTGEASGIDVLDIDPTGRKWLDVNFDALPQTRAHETQRGLHLLFKHAPGLRCSSNKIAEGIDIRADGGYAIYWPSTGLLIEDWPICEWPDWLLAEAGWSAPPRYPSKGNVGGMITTPLAEVPLPHAHVHDPELAADCTAALWEMNAKDWSGKHDQWFELLMACKHVGISVADFVEWCVSDPHYADDAEIIELKWHSIEPKHGGAFWRELSRRRIRLGKGRTGQGDNLLAEVPRRDAIKHIPSRNPSARLNFISNKISSNPTERALFSWACLAAEIGHECKFKPTAIIRFLEGAATSTPLWKTLGREGIRRTIGNAFRRVEEKYLATEESEMRRSGVGSGGGHGSKNVVRKPVKTGAGAKAAHLGGVSQLGNKVGNHLTDKSSTNYRGEPLFAGSGYNPSKYGNEVALNVGKGGCGTGRTIYASGSQGTQGSVNPGNPRPNPQHDALKGE
jgi:hypothetical protein